MLYRWRSPIRVEKARCMPSDRIGERMPPFEIIMGNVYPANACVHRFQECSGMCPRLDVGTAVAGDLDAHGPLLTKATERNETARLAFRRQQPVMRIVEIAKSTPLAFDHEARVRERLLDDPFAHSGLGTLVAFYGTRTDRRRRGAQAFTHPRPGRGERQEVDDCQDA